MKYHDANPKSKAFKLLANFFPSPLRGRYKDPMAENDLGGLGFARGTIGATGCWQRRR